MSRRTLSESVESFRAILRAPGAADDGDRVRAAWTNLGVRWTFASRAERYAAADGFRAAAVEFDTFAGRSRVAAPTT